MTDSGGRAVTRLRSGWYSDIRHGQRRRSGFPPHRSERRLSHQGEDSGRGPMGNPFPQGHVPLHERSRRACHDARALRLLIRTARRDSRGDADSSPRHLRAWWQGPVRSGPRRPFPQPPDLSGCDRRPADSGVPQARPLPERGPGKAPARWRSARRERAWCAAASSTRIVSNPRPGKLPTGSLPNRFL